MVFRVFLTCHVYRRAGQAGQGGGRGPVGERFDLKVGPYMRKMGQTRQCRPDTQHSSIFEPVSRIAHLAIDKGHMAGSMLIVSSL